MEGNNMVRPHKKTPRQTRMFIDNEGDGMAIFTTHYQHLLEDKADSNIIIAVEANRLNAEKH